MKKKTSIIFCLLISLVFISASNNDPFTRFSELLKLFNKEFPSEKIYVQTDKTYYKPSESIWYKGFLVNSTDNKPSSLSNIIYLELQDPWGNVVDSHEQYISSGTFNGKFDISNRPGGIYKIVGYTSWMKNWGEDYFFKKEITVQKLITPRLLLKMDFEKKAYGPNDDVIATLKITDLNNQKTTGSIAKATIRIGGKEYKKLESKSENGETIIHFKLPEDLDSTDGILQVVVTDKGVEESISRSVPIVLNKINLQFFPEGGELIAGTENKVAFEALNEFGKGADISAELLDSKGNIITSFSSYHLGMGAFTFKPEIDQEYFVCITTPIGNEESIKLPEVRNNGYALKLSSNNGKQTDWEIFSHTDNSNMSIVAQTLGVVQSYKQLQIKKGYNKVSIDTENFPMGIAVFTLFDCEKEIAERLVFINANKRLNIRISTNKENYDPEEIVKLVVNAADDNGNPVVANIGLAVVDEQILTLADDKQDNLLSYNLLSSELKGKIEEPSFYFDPEETKAKEALDYLLMTHGWRRFSWTDIINDNPPIIVTNIAEKEGSIYGYILDGNGNPTQAQVFLIEVGGKKRIAELTTTKEGHFVFHGVDISERIFISTKLPNRVYVIEGIPLIAKENEVINTEDGGLLDLSTPNKEQETLVIQTKNDSDGEVIIENFEGSSQALQEVVVSAYGIQKKRELTGSVVVVYQSPIMVTNDFVSALSGSVAGVIASPQNTALGNQNIRIRGISTLSSTEPLVIINGTIIEGDLTKALSFLDPTDISFINISKENNPIYGSRGMNGIISITTKSARFEIKHKQSPPKFSGKMVPKKEYYKSPIYLQERENSSMENSTVYWNGDILTDKNGKAEISFKNNKTSSTFRITAEGISSNGLLASTTKKIVTQNDFSLDAKVPIFAGCGDLIKIPVMLKNTTNKTLVADLSISADVPLSITTLPELNSYKIKVEPNSTNTVFIPLNIGPTAGDVNLTIDAQAGKYKDQIVREMTIRQINFPYQFGFSGRKIKDATTFDLPQYINRTLKAEAKIYIEMYDELFNGIESILREPYGCFEQVLSSALPNIFGLQLLETTGKNNDEIKSKAQNYLENGYTKLANYEVKKTGGFEWYGGSPAHEMLTAYGLVYFHEMAKVNDKVDQEMVDRALNYLLSRKDNKGGFLQNSGKYGFSGAPKNVNNAYIVYALHEIGKGNLIDKEYEVTLNEALSSKDIYRMALLANAAYQRNDIISYKKLVSEFNKIASNTDFSKIKFENTVVRSYGESANREAIAYWLLALTKESNLQELDLIQKCLQYISKGKQGGSFGNTQATSVCLQALSKIASLINNKNYTGNFCLDINGNKQYLGINDNIKSKTTIFFSEYLKIGNNKIETSFEDVNEPFPFEVNISWYSALPASSKLCPLQLSFELKSTDIKVNETARLSIILKNKEKTSQPMSVAVIGIPGGMSLQPWQLKELQEKEVFDFYEIKDDNLIIYYRELGPSEIKMINLDLKAEIPGKYTATASSAYVYYMSEHKYWTKGLGVEIKE